MDQLAINKEVVAQIAGMAALEVDGVSGLASKPMDIKGFVKTGFLSRSVRVSTENELIIIDAFINVFEDARIKLVAEEVQKNIKDKVQTMTGNAVARVNINICNIDESAQSSITENEYSSEITQ